MSAVSLVSLDSAMSSTSRWPVVCAREGNENKEEEEAYVGPASMRRTFHRGFSVRRLARTAPALAVIWCREDTGQRSSTSCFGKPTRMLNGIPPMTTKSYVVFSKVEKVSERRASAGRERVRKAAVKVRREMDCIRTEVYLQRWCVPFH